MPQALTLGGGVFIHSLFVRLLRTEVLELADGMGTRNG